MCLAVGVELPARDLEEAIAKSKDLKLADFIEFLGDHNDSSFRISGVFEGGGLGTP